MAIQSRWSKAVKKILAHKVVDTTHWPCERTITAVTVGLKPGNSKTSHGGTLLFSSDFTDLTTQRCVELTNWASRSVNRVHRKKKARKRSLVGTRIQYRASFFLPWVRSPVASPIPYSTTESCARAHPLCPHPGFLDLLSHAGISIYMKRPTKPAAANKAPPAAALTVAAPPVNWAMGGAVPEL